ncbi:hypothetical protein TcCL_Unassigned04156, partial [Trypanosoma cruzi]
MPSFFPFPFLVYAACQITPFAADALPSVALLGSLSRDSSQAFGPAFASKPQAACFVGKFLLQPLPPLSEARRNLFTDERVLLESSMIRLVGHVTFLPWAGFNAGILQFFRHHMQD